LLSHPFIKCAPPQQACLLPVIKRFFHLPSEAALGHPLCGSFDILRGAGLNAEGVRRSARADDEDEERKEPPPGERKRAAVIPHKRRDEEPAPVPVNNNTGSSSAAVDTTRLRASTSGSRPTPKPVLAWMKKSKRSPPTTNQPSESADDAASSRIVNTGTFFPFDVDRIVVVVVGLLC
jgi:hypothetical protein